MTKKVKNKHIIMIGFKSVGKSTVAKRLSHQMNMNSIDLDQEIEREYFTQKKETLTCREIMKEKGEVYFRKIESLVLEKVLKNRPSIIALGGGTVISKKNRALVKKHVIIHITANKLLVYKRTVAGGRPAYYDYNSSVKSTQPMRSMKSIFNEVWKERQKLYEEISTMTFDNSDDVEKTAKDIMNKIYTMYENEKRL